VKNLPDWIELLTRLRLVSEEMLDLAKAGEWEAVGEQEAQRCSLVEQLFAQPAPPAVIPAMATCIQEVLARDSLVLALGQAARDKLMQQVITLVQGRKACFAYEPLP
jgi:hypothetical protein